MTWRLLAALLVGFILGQLAPTSRVEAQSPHLLFVASSAGAVPAQGSTAGALSVNGQ